MPAPVLLLLLPALALASPQYHPAIKEMMTDPTPTLTGALQMLPACAQTCLQMSAIAAPTDLASSTMFCNTLNGGVGDVLAMCVKAGCQPADLLAATQPVTTMQTACSMLMSPAPTFPPSMSAAAASMSMMGGMSPTVAPMMGTTTMMPGMMSGMGGMAMTTNGLIAGATTSKSGASGSYQHGYAAVGMAVVMGLGALVAF